MDWYFAIPLEERLTWDTDRMMVETYKRDEDDLQRTLAKIRRGRGMRVEIGAPDTPSRILAAQCEVLEGRGLIRRLAEEDGVVRFISC